MKITKNGYTYEFFPALMNGSLVVGCSYSNGIESMTEWSAEPGGVPLTEDAALAYLTAFSWQVVDWRDKFIENPTNAELVASMLGNDGTRWETVSGVPFDALVGGNAVKTTDDTRELTRYEFPDGSAIVAGDSGWDIEGSTQFSWRGVEA